jgi:hypothetical protein
MVNIIAIRRLFAFSNVILGFFQKIKKHQRTITVRG